MEVLLKLKQLIDNLREETVQLESSIKEILACIDSDSIISELVSKDAISHLEIINKIHEECKESYLNLMGASEFPGTVKQVIAEVEKKEEELSKNKRYRKAIEIFCSLHSEVDNYESILADLKNELCVDDIYTLTEKECKEKFERYVDFIDAFNESDPGKLLDSIPKLASHFDARLVLGVVQKSLYIKEVDTQNVEEIPEQIVKEEDFSPDVLCEDADKISYKEQDSVVEEVLDSFEEMVNKESIVEEYRYLHEIHQLIEAKHFMTMSESKNSKKPFGVKLFKSDINGQSMSIRVTLLKCVFEYECVTEKVLQSEIPDEETGVEYECNYLVNKGYLKKYIIDGSNILYCLTSRGLKAFSTKDSASYLHIGVPRVKKELVIGGVDSAILQLIKARALVHTCGSVATRNFSYKEAAIDRAMILSVSVGERSNYVYTTIIDNKTELFEKYFKELNACISDMSTSSDTQIFVLGYDDTHARILKSILFGKLNYENVYCYNFSEDIWYDVNGLKMETIAEKYDETAITAQDLSEINKENVEEIAIPSGSNENDEVRFEEILDNPVLVEEAVSTDEASALIAGEATSNSYTMLYNDSTEASFVNEISTDNLEIEKQPIENIKPKQEIVDAYQMMICKDKIYCATAYLKAAAVNDAQIVPIYRKLAYAVNDPLEKCSYTSDALMGIFFDETSVSSDYFMVAALIRNYFMDHIKYDYNMQLLQAMTKGSAVLTGNSNLNQVAYDLFEFKSKVHSGIDKYADYRAKDKMVWEARVVSTIFEAKGHYDVYVLGQIAERGSHKRFIETQKLIFSKNGDIATYLKVVVDNDIELLDLMKAFIQENFIKTDALIDQVNIDDDKIDSFIDRYWEEAGQYMMVVRKTSDLMGSFRMNLFKRIQKIVKVLCDWIVLMENSSITENDEGFTVYKKIRKSLFENMDAVIETLTNELITIHEKEELVGRKVLLYTISELKRRLIGEYSDAESKYFYIGFLKNSKVLLDEDYFPNITERVLELEEFSPLERIYTHSQEAEMREVERLRQIFAKDDDYGTAQLLLKYIKSKGIDELELTTFPSIEEAIKGARKRADVKKDEFIENLELAQSYGQIENTLEDKKDKILQSVNEWFLRCNEDNNFGFFDRILKAFDGKIKEEAKGREETIKKELKSYCSNHKDLLEGDRAKERISKIQNMIIQQNYTVAEDLINRLSNDEVESEIELLQNDYLQQFINSYDYNYKIVIDAGKMVSRLVATNLRAKKDTKGGKRLVEHWLSNGGQLGDQKLNLLLSTMGFAIGRIQEQSKISEKIETYNIFLKKPENGRKSNYKHPIAAFGSNAVEDGFRVVCLYGKYDTDRLIDTFREIGNTKHTLVLLDYALSLSERRRLARKIKAEIPEKIFGVIDRVVLMYLINNYEETSINRMLMSVIMPYTYYQPYVVKSADIMPPEIFIGRKEELNKIESALGVNIVYGGRQLGKSALLRMAKTDINFDENGDRAVLVDIKGLDYKRAAQKIAQALTDEGVFAQDVDTNDWDELAREIKKRLSSSQEKKIPYLLLLIDEADVFIESCEKVDFHPFDALKDIQSIGQGRFKFVVAGLRNIVRFKRNIALGNNSVLTHLSSITVKPFNVMEARELLEIPLFYLGLRFPKEKDALVSMILATANYFPGLLQMYCAKLLEAMKKRDYAGYNENETPPYDVQEKHIKKVLSEAGFQQDIREKFMITLKVDEDDYYYVIALLTAYLYHMDNGKNGYSPEDVIAISKEFEINKVYSLSVDKVSALMEEMKELNVLRNTVTGRYLFTRYSFFQMMGTKNQIEEDIMNYMEE